MKENADREFNSRKQADMHMPFSCILTPDFK
jgi:hypothetical protein